MKTIQGLKNKMNAEKSLLEKVKFGTSVEHRDTLTFLRDDLRNAELFISNLQEISSEFLKG